MAPASACLTKDNKCNQVISLEVLLLENHWGLVCQCHSAIDMSIKVARGHSRIKWQLKNWPLARHQIMRSRTLCPGRVSQRGNYFFHKIQAFQFFHIKCIILTVLRTKIDIILWVVSGFDDRCVTHTKHATVSRRRFHGVANRSRKLWCILF